jgi:hypothetical protein
MQYWKPGAIFEVECPQCGRVVEFFKDDTARKCGGCGHRFPNPKMDFGCAAYCPYAEQCLGTLPEGVAAQKEDLLKDRVAVEMKRSFRTDFKRIGLTSRVARHAESIGKAEKGNLAVILTAAYLHLLGPEAGREILERLGARQELVSEVAVIIAEGRPPGPDASLNARVVHDAVLLEALDAQRKTGSAGDEELRQRISRSFLTDSGRREAAELLLNQR